MHLVVSMGMGWFEPFAFRAPVPLLPAISADLLAEVSAVPAGKAGGMTDARNARAPVGAGSRGNTPSAAESKPGSLIATPAIPEVAPHPESAPHPAMDPEPEVACDTKKPPSSPESRTDPARPLAVVGSAAVLPQKSIRRGDEFVPLAREKLTYRIILYGVPVGTAVMDATNRNGEVRISTRITSNPFISGIYQVDVSVDTRLINGNYLLTRIRQHEGEFIGDSGFTLMLRERNAFWVDRLHNRYANHPLPRYDVMDLVSGFYYLRSQPLAVGKQVVLHLFDSNEYDPTSVEVLRKERLHLSGLREVDTLVVHPVLKTAGFFRRTGDILIWLTDDLYRAPVRVETSIPLGRVTAELVSIEGEKEGGGAIPSYAETLAGE
ncbi:MAG: DUF3108 domain-containing protein [Geobacter sp.]|nr:DUF3108 domain-containing protein [Geobacter sp.]